jgi:hypothetical protein
MDWFSVLLLVIFVVLPLVQQFLQKREPQRPDLPEQQDWEALPPMSDRGDGAARRRITKVEDVSPWSEGWGAWPGEAAEQDDDEEMLADEIGMEEPPAPEVLPAQHPPAPLVVSMEPLNVDRAAEHQRFHDRYVARPRAAPPPRPAAAHSPIAAMLRDPQGMRRAVILSEVLGPPRSLQPANPQEE